MSNCRSSQKKLFFAFKEKRNGREQRHYVKRRTLKFRIKFHERHICRRNGNKLLRASYLPSHRFTSRQRNFTSVVGLFAREIVRFFGVIPVPGDRFRVFTRSRNVPIDPPKAHSRGNTGSPKNGQYINEITL